MKLNFYKTPEKRWYIDLPEWTGDISDLEMVLGADKMLDLLDTSDCGKVSLEVFKTRDNNTIETGIIELSQTVNTYGSGATYIAQDSVLSFDPFELWLCPVTLFVLNEYPVKMFIKVI